MQRMEAREGTGVDLQRRQKFVCQKKVAEVVGTPLHLEPILMRNYGGKRTRHYIKAAP